MGSYFILCLKIKPYRSRKLNALSYFSMITINFTVGFKTTIDEDSKLSSWI